MPAANEIRNEITSGHPCDVTRRKYLKRLQKQTGRPVVVYASCFTVKAAPGGALSINLGDVQLFMSALNKVKGDKLDLIIHTPGGSAEATEQIVKYLRQKFTDLRVIVPQAAMSAGTMLACAANKIVMGRHSALGPIDPQLTMPTPDGQFTAAAQSLVDEFNAAVAAIKANPNSPDVPILVARLKQYPPGFLTECNKAIKLAKQLVKEWLKAYMFRGDAAKASTADAIGEWLGTNQNFLTHGRPISALDAQQKGLDVDLLEDDQKLQDAVLSVFHATTATFEMTPCLKFSENHEGRGSFVMGR